MTQPAAPDGTSTPVGTGTIPALDEDQLRGPMLDRLLLDGGADCYKPPIRAHGHDPFGTGTGFRTLAEISGLSPEQRSDHRSCYSIRSSQSSSQISAESLGVTSERSWKQQ
jgi:hypothetical protein